MEISDKSMALAKDLSERSTIKIKVGAVLYDKYDILAWGWNNPGNGYGEHAECMAIRRFANNFHARKSSRGINIAVYASRKGRSITSRPCSNCERVLCRYGIMGAIYNRKYFRIKTKNTQGYYFVSREAILY